MFGMKKKMPTCIKDGIIGMAFGIAAIIPGIAGGTVLLITGTIKKVTDAVIHLISKNFWRNFLILIPFGIGAVLSFGALIFPLNLAMEYCMFAIVCLFAGLIIGTIPTVTDKVKGKPRKKGYYVGAVVSFIIAALIGLLSWIFGTNTMIDQMFVDRPFYIYFYVVAVGFVCSSGLIIPGFSGSMLCLALCFYQPVLGLFKFKNPGSDISIIGTFLVGAIIGFFFFSKIINHFLKKHETGTYWAAIGLVLGSLIAIYGNGKMVDYIKSPAFDIIDFVLAPILLILGLAGGIFFTRYIRKHPEFEENA